MYAQQAGTCQREEGSPPKTRPNTLVTNQQRKSLQAVWEDREGSGCDDGDVVAQRSTAQELAKPGATHGRLEAAAAAHVIVSTQSHDV